MGGYVVHSPGDATSGALPDGRTLSSGTTVLGADGALAQNVGSSTGIDADGALLHLSYFNSPTESTYPFTGGTGKFAGAKGSGTSEVAAVGPDGRLAIRHDAALRTR